ncbi:MAG: alpha/beta hydrolase [Dehalococcoidia bacterium]|nr:alpha/beta hydrolase [Dehalococcoidia bacterium]
MIVKANGISMNYEVNGRGENLVLIHGLGDNLDMWYNQVPVFPKSFRVITYDVRGSGKTEIPKEDYSLTVLVEDAHELMKAIGAEKACLLGYSMGGRIAFELAVKYPEMAKALVLANSSVGLVARSPQATERRRLNQELLEKGNIEKAAENMTTGAFSPGFKSRSPAEFERYRKVKLQNRAEGIAQLMRSLTVPTPPPDLSRLKCSVLLVVGENDINMGVEQAKREQAALPGSKLVILPTGHASAVEMPQRFNQAVLEFLSQIRSK